MTEDDIIEILSKTDDPIKLQRFEKLLTIRDTRVDFAKNFHRNTKGDRMNFTIAPHLKDIYNTLSPDIALQGSVQSMKSEFMVVDHFACAAAGLSVFLVLPKFESRVGYVQNRINKCISQVPKYQELLASGMMDSMVLKQFGKGVIKYVGSNVVADFKEFPADVMFVEEVDQCCDDNLGYGIDRLRASPYQFKRYVGNPTFNDRGINKYFKQSTMNCRWTECEKCGHMNEMDWFTIMVETIYNNDGMPTDYKLRDQDWVEGKPVNCICGGCGLPFDRFSDGEWRPKNPDAQMEGFYLNQMMSRFNSLDDMWNRFRNSMGDSSEMQKFYNSDLGIPYTAFDSMLTPNHLEAATRIEPYELRAGENCAYIAGHKAPTDKTVCSMGVDVGKFFDVRISEVREGGYRRMLYCGKVGSLDELYELGHKYNVECCVMDSGPEYHTSHEFQDNAPFFVWLARYGSEGSSGKIKRDKKSKVMSADRTAILDKTFAELRGGKNLLPVNFGAILGGEYVDEMTCSVREFQEDKGKYIWTKGKDHQRHADVYDYMASTMLVHSIDVLEGIMVG